MKKQVLFCVFIFAGACLFGQHFLPNYSMHNAFSEGSLTPTPFADDNKALRAENNKWPAFFLNSFLGLGIGSFFQGDIFGGIVGLVSDLSFNTLMVFGGLLPLFNSASLRSYHTVFLYTGVIGFIGSRVFQVIRPFYYANKFAVTVSPSISENGQLALVARIAF